MKKLLKNFKMKTLVSLFFALCITSLGYGQTINMSVNNCIATANEIQFDVTVTNNGPAALQFNNTVIRLNHSAAILAGGTNTLVFSYVGNSDFPLVWPPNSNPTFTYNAGTRLFGVATSVGIYVNGATCAAPNIASGETKKLGRFSLKNSAQNFVSGADVGLTWNNTSSVGAYVSCAQSITGFNQANGNRTLDAPCTLAIPVTCSSPTVATNPTDKSVCTAGTTTFTGSFTGGTPAPTLLWQVQTGGIGAFTDLTEAAPYSGTATGTLTITSPNISLNTNRYRLKASNTCGDVFTTDALLTVTAAPNAGTVSGASPLCISKTTTYTSDGDAGGVWSSSNTTVATVDAAGVVTTLSGGTADITYTINGGCAVAAFKTLTVTAFTTLAGTANDVQVCNSGNMLAGKTSFSDASCNLIASVTPSGADPVSGSVNACVIIESSVHTYQSVPYAQRHYDIIPATNAVNATAIITIYYPQSEFDAFNLSRGAYPALPGGPGDVVGIGNIRITQFHGTGTNPGNYTGSSVLINPADADIIWNATAGRWEISFAISGFSGFYLFTNPSIPLPISLVNFSGKNNGNVNVLAWTTSSEQNSSYYDIERSIDGINFVKAGSVNAAGNSSITKNYNYNDNIVSLNSNIYYYRLKMVETTGIIKYSSVVKIKLNSKGFNVEATPNPFSDQIKINIENPVSEKTIVTLNDVSGRKMKQTESTLLSGNNALLMTDLGKLPSGVYLLTVTTESQRQTVKVIKK